MTMTVGSVCSGIEAASVAWKPLGYEFKWFSEIAEFPAKILADRYPDIPNLGDMNDIPQMLLEGQIDTTDLICGGTPCQTFSMAGHKLGLHDERGNLSIKFIDIIEANDSARRLKGLPPCALFWENVEGVLSDKTNAFGLFVTALAGLESSLEMKRWPNAGLLRGPKRNVAWRILDAKYFGLPQQRRRLFVLAGGKDFHPENILFEKHFDTLKKYPSLPLAFEKDGHLFETFREYTDCLYSAYGTKWNGNAAAYNGSLFVMQNGRVRRLSPLECERLMGFPDNYTDIARAHRTNRYKAVGNSWAVPVVSWIGERLLRFGDSHEMLLDKMLSAGFRVRLADGEAFYDFGRDIVQLDDFQWNCSAQPEETVFSSMMDIVSPDAPEEIYMSPVGCYGILRRKNERKLPINPRLEEVLVKASGVMTIEEIERRSMVQKRGSRGQAAWQMAY